MMEFEIFVEDKSMGVVEAHDEMDAINFAYENWHIEPDMMVEVVPVGPSGFQQSVN